MGHLRRTRGGVVLLATVAIAVTACDRPQSTVPPGALGPGIQMLQFPVIQDPKTWDPAEIDSAVDRDLMQNVFDNLWRLDDRLRVVPDIATAVPSIANGGVSADGLTYVVHLKPGVRFSNGDAVTSSDVLYSWNRS